MYLFIDVISPDWALILFNDDKIISESRVSLKWKEFNNLLENIEDLLKQNLMEFKDLSWITVINWPWSFTWTRVIALIVNTLILVYGIKVEAIGYFRFLELSEASCPMFIKANKNEYLVRISSSQEPIIENIGEVKDGAYFWIWDNIDFENRKIYIKSISDYSIFFKNYRFDWKAENIEPLYIKKPNIT